MPPNRVDLPLLTNIFVSHQTRVAIEGVTQAIATNSGVGDSVFVFPNIPIFYLLADRYPPTYTVVQWFDFLSGAERHWTQRRSRRIRRG